MIDIDALFKVKSLASIKASEDQVVIYFTEAAADLENDKYITRLKAYDIKEREDYYLPLSDFSGLYAPYKQGIVYKSADEEKEEVYRYYDGREDLELFRIKGKSLSQIEPIAEDSFLVVYCEKDEEKKTFMVFDHYPFWFNGQGYLEGKVKKLGILNLDGEISAITGDYEELGSFKVNPEKSLALYSSSSRQPLPDYKSDLYQLDLKTMEKEQLLAKAGLGAFDYFGDQVYYMANDPEEGQADYGINQDSALYKLGGEKIFESLGNFGNTVNSDLRQRAGGLLHSGDRLLALATIVDRSVIYDVISKEGLASMDSIDDFIQVGDEIYALGLTEDRAQELYLILDGQAQRLTGINSEFPKAQFEVQSFEFENDGAEHIGYVLVPDKAENAPGILTIHGGPKTVFGTAYHHEMQMLASQGYYVFFMNPRGSDGRGNDYSNIRGIYGSVDYSDLMALTDEVIKRYSVDQDRLGLMGGSYGGFMTNWIVGHTNRFKAAVTQRSISNWISFYGTSDIGYFFGQDQCGTDPWEDLDKMWDLSPLKYANQVKTPTLIIHSDQDYRCPLEQAQQMYTALIRHGVKTRMVIFEGDNHDLSRSGKPKNRKERLEEIVNWMGKYLKD